MAEFAVSMPLLLLLLAGIFDFSLAIARGVQLTAAVQEGASYARRSPNDSTNIRDHVKKEGSQLGLSDGDITISCFSGLTTTSKACSAATFGDSVKVEATHNYVPLTGRLASITGSPIQIVQSATSAIY
jgi:Flp pilus assembly protein TadG